MVHLEVQRGGGTEAEGVPTIVMNTSPHGARHDLKDRH